MMPPTGITFIVHGLVVIVRKTASLFGFTGKKKYKKVNSQVQIVLSMLIVSLVSAYVVIIIIFFVGRGVHDNYANWKVASRTIDIAKGMTKTDSATIIESMNSPDINTSDISQVQAPLDPQNFIYTNLFFPSSVSPYVSLYTKNLGIIYQLVPIIFTRI